MQALGPSAARGAQPKRRKAHAMTVLRGSTSVAIVHGGEDEHKHLLKDMHFYHAQRREWTAISYCDDTRPTGRKMHSLTSVAPSVLLVFGGLAAGEGGGLKTMNDLWYFDVRNMFWNEIKTKGTAPSRRAGHSAVFGVSADGIPGLFVFGGAADAAVYRVSTLDWTWTRLAIVDRSAPAPVAREGHSAVWVESLNGMLISGGMSKSSQETKMLNDMWLLRSAGRKKWKWTEIHLPGLDPHAGHSMVLLPSVRPRIIIWGGRSKKGQSTTICSRFTLVHVTGRKFSCHSARSAEAQGFSGRMLQGCVLVGDIFLVYGGVNEKGDLIAGNGLAQVRFDKKMLYLPEDDKYNSPAGAGREIVHMSPHEQPAMQTQVVGRTDGAHVMETKFDGKTFMGLVKTKNSSDDEDEEASRSPEPMDISNPPPSELLQNLSENQPAQSHAARDASGNNSATGNAAAPGSSMGNPEHQRVISGRQSAAVASLAQIPDSAIEALKLPPELARREVAFSDADQDRSTVTPDNTVSHVLPAASGGRRAVSSNSIPKEPLARPPPKDPKSSACLSEPGNKTVIMDNEKYNNIMPSAAIADAQRKQELLRMQQEVANRIEPNPLRPGGMSSTAPQVSKTSTPIVAGTGNRNMATSKGSTNVSKTSRIEPNVQNFIQSLNKAVENSKANKTISIAAPQTSTDPLRLRVIQAKKVAAEQARKNAAEKMKTLNTDPMAGGSSTGFPSSSLQSEAQPAPLKKAKIDPALARPNAIAAVTSARVSDGAAGRSTFPPGPKQVKTEPSDHVAPKPSSSVPIAFAGVVDADAFEPAKHRQHLIDSLPDFPESDDEGKGVKKSTAAANVDEADDVIVIDD